MKNKRGAELPVSTIIVVILVILVLVIVAAAFTGGMRSMFDKIKTLFKIYSATDEEAARQICNSWCSAGSYKAWCTDTIKVGEKDMICGETRGEITGLGTTCITDKGDTLPANCGKYP